MNTRRIYLLDGARFSALMAGQSRQRAIDWMHRAREARYSEAKLICVSAARTEHRSYVRWLRSTEAWQRSLEPEEAAEIDEHYDCPLHGEQDGPGCARC